MRHGESECRTSFKDIRWVKWMDKKPIQLLSNFHDSAIISTTERTQKDDSKAVISCSEIVKDYNQYMGYVDKVDMLKSTYEIDRKSRRWWTRIFWYFVDITVNNAFIIYKQLKADNKLTLKDFRLRIVDGLVALPERTRRDLENRLK